MKINTLVLENFRGAREITLDFHKSMNIFFGVNGSGKSTVLDAISVMLSWSVNRLRTITASGRPVVESDITNGKTSSVIRIHCSYHDQNIDWKQVKNRKGHKISDEKSDYSGLMPFIRSFQDKITNTHEKTNLPLFVYYPVHRAVIDIPLRIKNRHNFNLLDAYEKALTGGADFRTFFEWFREREDLENENRKYRDDLIKPDGYQFPDPQLETVRSALAKFLPGFINLTVRRNPLRMEVEKYGQRLTVNQLSDGEKCLIAMIADLARRMAIANPVMKTPLEGNGIVLIDEIDLHLHPQWQRMIITKLNEVFPNCQFIISTHSPHILTHVESEKLYLLKQTKTGITAERPAESYGKNVDRILEDLMGLETTRPDEVNGLLTELFEAITNGDIDSAKKQMTNLKNEIREDPELVKAAVLIKRKEILGK